MFGFYMLKCVVNNYNYVVVVGDICLYNVYKVFEIVVGFFWWIDNFINFWYFNLIIKF